MSYELRYQYRSKRKGSKWHNDVHYYDTFQSAQAMAQVLAREGATDQFGDLVRDVELFEIRKVDFS